MTAADVIGAQYERLAEALAHRDRKTAASIVADNAALTSQLAHAGEFLRVTVNIAIEDLKDGGTTATVSADYSYDGTRRLADGSPEPFHEDIAVVDTWVLRAGTWVLTHEEPSQETQITN